MKIFKNKVGRPSNTTMRNRRIIIIIAIIIFIGLIVVNKDIIFNLKGAVEKTTISVSYNCDTLNGSTDKCSKLSIKIKSSEKVYFNYKLGNYKTYTISKANPKTSFSFNVVEAFKKSKLGEPSVTDGKITINVYNAKGTKINNKKVVLKQNGFEGKTYYYDQTDYSNTVFCGRSDGDSISYAGCGLVSSAMAMSALSQTRVLPEVLNNYVSPANNGGKDKYACTGDNGIEEIEDLIQNYGVEKLGINFKVETVWTVSEAISKLNENKGKSVAIFHSKNDAFTRSGHYYFISGITGSGDDDYIYIYDPNNGDNDSVNGSSKLKNGKWRIGDYKYISKVTVMYIITNIGNAKNVTLSCPKSAKIGEAFSCTTDQTGVKITLGGAKSLASGIKSSYTITSGKETENIKYAAKLFTDYKSYIKKDSNGEYINARVAASKTGYKETTKYVKIYRTATTQRKTNATKKTTSNNDAKKANFKVSAVWKSSGKDKKFNIIQGTFGSKVKYVTYVVCETQAQCVRSDAWDYMKEKDSSSVTYKIKAKKGDEVSLTLKTADSNEPANKKYYIRRSTYDNNKNILYYSVYEIKTASKSRKGKAGNVYDTSSTYITGKFY